MTVQQTAPFLHSALIADTDRDVITALAPELRRSAEVYDEVLLVVSEPTRTLLTGQTGDLRDVLQWRSPAAFYQRLGFAYEAFRRYLAEHAAAGRQVHVIAEPQFTGRAGAEPLPDRAAAYLAYEAVCNETYAPYGSAVTCLWDRRRYPPTVMHDVEATHTHLLTPAGRHLSPSYVPADKYLADRRPATLTAPQQVDQEHTLTQVTQLSGLRAALTGWAAARGFGEELTDDLIVAVAEVASNGLRHAATPVRVRAWHHHDTLVVQCDDDAGMPVPATAGYHRPDSADALPGGRGLWLAHQLADIVQVASAPGRTSVRLHFPYSVMNRRMR
jgi:anti-sigma regulatory factor (Ser/Thr protein kinase)